MIAIQKAYKFRIYPNANQRNQLAVEFGNARLVWNKCLELRSKAWEERQERHSYVSLNRLVTQWKQGEFPWLADSAACCLTQCLIDQDKAFKNCFEKRGRYPKFKSRFSRQSVRYPLDQRQIKATYGAGVFLKLPKLGFIKVRWSQIPKGTPKMATVSKDACGRYLVAFACEIESTALPATGKGIGLDLGIKDVVVGSDGFRSGNPRHLRTMQRRLKHQQRALARKRKGSNRRRRQRVRVAKLHAGIAACRANFLHETTTAIIRRADVIALEDLNVRGMMNNHHLAGGIGDVGMHEFRRQIEYKAAWNGRQVIIADRWAPTSKVCSACGSYQEKMPLRVRTWICPDCGTEHDRDINAARNVLIFATGGEPGRDAHRGGKNLSPSVQWTDGPGTSSEVRTEARCAGASHG